ncbi:MAG: hypothetical protein K9W43_06210 [Candidatus Thorarchaeota archaeon]|nr:hypothetical protein [Candidatus Thorarchaeota archaeon]
MNAINRSTALYFIGALILGIMSLIIGAFSGNLQAFTYIVLFLGPVLTIVIGTIGIRKYSQSGEIIGSDQFSAMNSFFALGVIVLTLSEAMATIVWFLPNPVDYLSIIFILQLPGLLLWALGVTSYFQGCIATIGNIAVKKAHMAVVVAAIITSIIITQLSNSSIVVILSEGPALVVLLISAYSLGWLLWSFRHGTLRVHIGLLLLATGIFLAQNLAWNIFGVLPTQELARILTIEAYLAIGATQAMTQTS